MRVAVVSGHANPLGALGREKADGHNVHVAALAAGLVRDGHDVTVYTRRYHYETSERVHRDGFVVEHVPDGPPAEVASAGLVFVGCTEDAHEDHDLRLPEGRARVIPCGVDTDLFRPGPGPFTDRLRLLSMGRMVPGEGMENAIEALAHLVHEEGLDAELVIAGGPSRSRLAVDTDAIRLRQLAIRHHVAGRTIFQGSVAPDEVPWLVRGSDVVVAVPWYEPFATAPVEAMACGRPVVGTSVGGVGETVIPGVTGDLVSPRRPDELAQTLASLLRDPVRRRRYGDAARDHAVARYDWRRVLSTSGTAGDSTLLRAPEPRPEPRPCLSNPRLRR
ncbi:glycosyltransferase involved in cell wall biosynthesis [Nocardioides luteus]|uniref:Glycosyl transferase family 1 domain-containing protein n=1 Tax=Nocardioides luteus TaxID=1844 RepID=A0ABQ5STZ4_9ACTN|nr:glycosyltransferase [Nocardioides luteus]MDR7310130.1 glycosyltransferase involved in cell wall biosynthesis [Nocardioides luteus]GGR64606.1 hypothetical protein GCM10010197_35020 [Nocardioides luteus]GLJ66962.1 hypothetical protein GCM10017579_09980 [Nocardioides luteus]